MVVLLEWISNEVKSELFASLLDESELLLIKTRVQQISDAQLTHCGPRELREQREPVAVNRMR